MIGVLVSKVGAWKLTAGVVLPLQVFFQITTEGLDEAVVDLGVVSSF